MGRVKWGHAVQRAIEWRVLASGLTFLAAYLVTGRLGLSVGVAILDLALKTAVLAVWLRYRT